MSTIEIDAEVLEALGARARPFVDTPNSVLRRLLGLNPSVPGDGARSNAGQAEATDQSNHQGGIVRNATPHVAMGSGSSGRGISQDFVHRILREEFGGGFRVRSPYQMMFESESHLVYFQNFNAAGSHNLWYRLNDRPMQILRSTGKHALVGLTVPAEGSFFLIPVQEIVKKATRAEWNRPELEVNIDPANLRWRELNWDLAAYRKSYSL